MMTSLKGLETPMLQTLAGTFQTVKKICSQQTTRYANDSA